LLEENEVALKTDVGAIDADSYASLAEGDAFAASHLYAAAWIALADASQEAALRMARVILDASPKAWTGSQATQTQALRWPRIGMLTRDGVAIPSNVNPEDLKRAQWELARQLALADRTADNSIINQGITSLSAGSVSLSFADASVNNSLLVTRSIRELNALAAVLPDAVKFLIPPSWFLPDAEAAAASGQFLFEVL
jgi:hypothetical protein